MPQDTVPDPRVPQGTEEPAREPQARRASVRGGRPALSGRTVGLLAIGAFAALGLWQVSGLSDRLRPLPLPTETATAMATRTPMPTWTPTQKRVPTPTALPTQTPTPVPVVMAGARVVVNGTGADELRLRSGPGVTSETLGTLTDGTPLSVLDGPQTADGHNWWMIATDDGQQGWVAGDWLLPVSP